VGSCRNGEVSNRGWHKIDIPGTTGLTPLHWARKVGNLETVSVLVDEGAKDTFGHTRDDVALGH